MNANKYEFLDKFPILETERLLLVEIKEEHLLDLFKLYSDEKVAKYIDINPLSEQKEAEFLISLFSSRFKDKKGIRWGISLKGAKNIIGTIGFNHMTKGHRAEIGYDLQSKYWNKGYTTEAINAVIKFGFGKFEVNRIEADVIVGNIQSDKVLLKNGFQFEGILRDWILFDGKHFDVNMYSLLRKEYFTN